MVSELILRVYSTQLKLGNCMRTALWATAIAVTASLDGASSSEDEKKHGLPYFSLANGEGECTGTRAQAVCKLQVGTYTGAVDPAGHITHGLIDRTPIPTHCKPGSVMRVNVVDGVFMAAGARPVADMFPQSGCLHRRDFRTAKAYQAYRDRQKSAEKQQHAAKDSCARDSNGCGSIITAPQNPPQAAM